MNKKILVKMYGGSRLYGTYIEGKSDTDYLGIYLPTIKELILNKFQKQLTSSTSNEDSKNSVNDIDCTMYSLHYFLDLVRQGQTVAIDMLCSSKYCWLNSSIEWEYLVANRKKLFTKNMKAFLGYAVSQSHIYSNKGERLNLLDELLIDVKNKFNETETISFKLSDFLNQTKLEDYKNKFGENNINYLEINKEKGILVPMLEVCGRKFQETITIKKFVEGLHSIKSSYGKRAKEAAENNCDFKAVSHAFRVLYECKEIAETGDLQLPLKNAKEILNIKQGKVSVEECFKKLETLLYETKLALDNSKLPEQLDSDYLDKFIMDIYNIKGE